VLGFGFLHYDDNAYITENEEVLQGLTLHGLWSAFAIGYNSSWQPLAILSHMLDMELWDLRGGFHHLSNLLLHMASSVLLFLLLIRMTGARWESAFAAALFALHPLHVEPVAWLSSRKDVLSTLFMFLAMGSYLTYVKTGRTRAYAVLSAWYALGLLSKPMLVTFPFVLLLLDYWPLNRMEDFRSFGKHVAEKIPLFGLTAACIAATLYFQSVGGAVKTLEQFPLKFRLMSAAISCATYLGKTFVPRNMATYYPHPLDSPNLATVTGCLFLLGLITALTIWRRRKEPYLLVGWLWFLGTLAPVTGVVQFGSHSMADRYTYISLIGLFVAVVWAVAQRPAWRRAAACIGVAALTALMLLASRQVHYWKDDVTLFTHALAVTRPNAVAHNNLGYGLQLEGRLDEAALHFEQALAHRPGYPVAHSNLGAIYALQGELDRAVEHLVAATNSGSADAVAFRNLAKAREESGNLPGALEARIRVTELEPFRAQGFVELGDSCARGAVAGDGGYAEAIGAYRKALSLDPKDLAVRYNLANALARSGNRAEALAEARGVVEADPEFDLAREFVERLRTLEADGSR
jgi:Flp pilus assembly protein TadD